MKPLTVLYIDDDEEDVEIFRDAIERCDQPVACLAANDGEHALSLISEMDALPDLIFLDINMPRMGGKECLRQLKANPTTQSLPVIVYSTSNNPTEIKEYLDRGAVTFIAKHSSFQRLCEDLLIILNSLRAKST